LKLVLSRQAHGAENAVAYELDDGTSLRWELLDDAPADAMIAAGVDLDPGVDRLLRLDRVDFPPGGVAYRHTHPGPGIRCLLFGSIRIESGPEPVFAAASTTDPSAFVRAMLLPEKWRGKRTIRYVDPADEEKPKLQRATVFMEQPVRL